MEGFSFILARAFEFFSLMVQSRQLGTAAFRTRRYGGAFSNGQLLRPESWPGRSVEIVIAFHGALTLCGGRKSAERPW